jgi:predicted dehydrogenase
MVKKLRMGLVGLNFGKYLLEHEILDKKGTGYPFFQVTAVSSKCKNETDAVAQEWAVKPHYTIDSMLNEDEIDVVCLITDPIGRAELIRKIIRAGKDVMTTKPFETNADEAQSVLEEAKSLGRIVHLNSPTPVPSQDLVQIMEWRQQYNLGRPIAAHWQTWCKYNEKSDGKWYDDSEQCPVAPVFRLGIYCLNDLLWLFKNPKEVQVMQSRISTGRPTSDNGLLTIKFMDNSLASIFASFCVAGGSPYPDILTLNFENGTVYRNAGIAKNRPEGGAQLELVTGSPENPITEKVILEKKDRSGSYMWQYFYEAVCSRKTKDEIPPKQVADSIRIIDAMRRASFSQRTEEVADASCMQST